MTRPLASVERLYDVVHHVHNGRVDGLPFERRVKSGCAAEP